MSNDVVIKELAMVAVVHSSLINCYFHVMFSVNFSPFSVIDLKNSGIEVRGAKHLVIKLNQLVLLYLLN